MLSFTDKSVAQIRQLEAEKAHEGQLLRIFVDAGGCSGFEYGMSFDEIKEALTSDYESDEIDEASEKFKVIRDKVGIYVLEDPSGDSDSGNVFSWDIKKYFNQ